MTERDKIHFSFNEIDGYNKPFNYVISAREGGKSVAWVLDKAYKKFKKDKKTTLVIRRKVVDLTEAYILSIQFIINKFIDENVRLEYKSSELKNGVIYVYIGKDLFMGIVALSIDIYRLKSLILPKIGVIIFDEFIVNPEFGEKYLKNEVDKFKEVYNTYQRESDGLLKCYFCGNAYTRYNPYFIDTGVNLQLVLPDTILSGDTWAIQSYKISDELFNLLKSKNPLYSRDDAYSKYALNGQSVNDEGIKISMLKNNYKLWIVCTIADVEIGIFKNMDVKSIEDDKFYCQPVNYNNLNRDIFCFELEDLLSGNNIMYNSSDSQKFVNFRLAMRRNKVAFSDIATYYNIKEIYKYI